MTVLLFLAALFVAFSNGANDNFKGFATVWGTDLLSYRQALVLATLATMAGALLSLYWADSLVQQFSGKGLVPDVVANTPEFLLSVAFGSALTIFIATRLGLPISTTHALIGGLIGAGLSQSGNVVNFQKLFGTFFLPLMISPVLAAILGLLVYRLFKLMPARVDCACLVTENIEMTTNNPGFYKASTNKSLLVIDSATQCDQLETQAKVSITEGKNRLHVISAMSICFARSVNDTPKLSALLVAAKLFNIQYAILVMTLAMVIGGLLYTRKVAETMSRKMTLLTHDQGLSANLITAFLVLFSSKLGLPVSTTHVSVGAISGVGMASHSLNYSALQQILLSWLATLPLAATLAWFCGQFVGG